MALLSDIPSLFAGVGANGSAKDFITNYLGQYGLDALAGNVWAQYQAGVPVDQIMINVRSTPEYQARFPAMQTLSKNGRAISEADYISWEKSATAALHAANITDPNFYSHDYLGKYIAGETSAQEFAQKVDLAQKAAQQPSEFRNQLEQFYGPQSNGSYASFFLDPDHALPTLQTQFQSSQIAARAQQAAFGQLTKQQAEGLSNNGISDSQAQTGFNDLAKQSELFGNLPGENGDNIDQNTQLQAEFQGNAFAQKRIEAKRGARKSDFGTGASTAQDVRGASGLGVAGQ